MQEKTNEKLLCGEQMKSLMNYDLKLNMVLTTFLFMKTHFFPAANGL